MLFRSYFRDSIRISTDLTSAGYVDGASPPAEDEPAPSVHLKGKFELFRTKTNKRMYNARIKYHLEEIGNEKGILRKTNTIQGMYKIE